MEDSGASIFKGWILPIIVAVIAAIIINKSLFFMAVIPSPSMHPTLKVGDRVFVTKIYNKGSLKRGDIIVFNSKELGIVLVKRLIGLPGDTVEVRTDGSVYINGAKIDEPYVKTPGGESGTFVVPKDSYFFMGDNRADSFDSRYWKQKYIPWSALMGKARFIVFPFNRASVLK
jgi:signal peptidase I, bacterial type